MPKTKKAPRTWARDPEKEKFWRKVFAEYAVSGISIQEFCRQRKLSAGSFGAWKRELQIRERETVASGSSTSATPLPCFPSKVKDSRGRTIPARLSKWLSDSKASQVSPPSSPFAPLTLVGPTETFTPDAPPQVQQTKSTQLEVVSPGGYTVRLHYQVDTEFVSKLLHSLEGK